MMPLAVELRVVPKRHATSLHCRGGTGCQFAREGRLPVAHATSACKRPEVACRLPVGSLPSAQAGSATVSSITGIKIAPEKRSPAGVTLQHQRSLSANSPKSIWSAARQWQGAQKSLPVASACGPGGGQPPSAQKLESLLRLHLAEKCHCELELEITVTRRFRAKSPAYSSFQGP